MAEQERLREEREQARKQAIARMRRKKCVGKTLATAQVPPRAI